MTKLLLIALAVSAGAGGAVALGEGGVSKHSPDEARQAACRVGRAPTRPVPRVRAEEEEGIRRTTRPTVLGCGRLPSGRRFELVGYRQTTGRGRRTILCIDTVLLPRGDSFGCGDETVARGGHIEAGGVTTEIGKRTIVEGSASASVASVVVRYGRGRTELPRRAVLIRVRRESVLRKIRVRGAFGYYLGEAPPRSLPLTVEARDEHGRTIGRATFSRTRPPGSGRGPAT
jgi:hypothetical protein